MQASEVEGHVESLNQLVERRTTGFWLGTGALGVAALLGATAFLVGVGDGIAVGCAVLFGSGATGAAIQRRRLAALPLQVASTLAVATTTRGEELTVRGWLGRGRAVDSLSFRVTVAGEPVEVLAAEGPAVGCFQAVFTSEPGDVEVTLEVREGARTHTVEHTYEPAARTSGRFVPGVRGKPLRFVPAEWGRVSPEEGAESGGSS